jgi:hypothetical protein
MESSSSQRESGKARKNRREAAVIFSLALGGYLVGRFALSDPSSETEVQRANETRDRVLMALEPAPVTSLSEAERREEILRAMQAWKRQIEFLEEER